MSREKDIQRPIGQARAHRVKDKRPWVRPALTRLAASDAEVGTQAAGDGAFTSS